MKVHMINVSSVVRTLAVVAKVQDHGTRIKVKIGNDEVSLRRNHKGVWELNDVYNDYRFFTVFYSHGLEKMTETQLRLVGAAMIAAEKETIMINDVVIGLEHHQVQTVVVEREVTRTVIVEAPKRTTRVITTRELPPRQPEMSGAEALGTLIGLGLGALGRYHGRN